MSTIEKVKKYFETINLNRYDLGGCEIVEEDLEQSQRELILAREAWKTL